MKFTVINNSPNNFAGTLYKGIIEACRENGDNYTDSTEQANYVLNFSCLEKPNVIRRKSRSLAVITLITGNIDGQDEAKIKMMSYNALVTSLSNLVIYISPSQQTYFTTPEVGFYRVLYNPQEVYRRMQPIIGCHFATDNCFERDLPERYWNGSLITNQINYYGRLMSELGVLPVPFPLKEFLTDEQLKHLYKIFGITGASYGNLSARERIPELGENTFWMTGRGVNKSNLTTIGKDILLVKDFDYKNYRAVISMPETYNPRSRVSVDAVEHSLIYKTFPEIGAIIHVHAWIKGVECTRQNYPCGTIELAHEVLELLKKQGNPCSTAVGLKNHGLTITGKNLNEIFDKFSHKLVREVEMFA